MLRAIPAIHEKYAPSVMSVVSMQTDGSISLQKLYHHFSFLCPVMLSASKITVGQRNYFTTSVTLLYQLPLLAVLFITGNNNVIFRTLPQ